MPSPTRSAGAGETLKTQRRDRQKIIGEMLGAISTAQLRGERRLTLVAKECNLPYDRFVTYIVKLQQRGIVDANDPCALTQDGRMLLQRYVEWQDALIAMRAEDIG